MIKAIGISVAAVVVAAVYWRGDIIGFVAPDVTPAMASAGPSTASADAPSVAATAPDGTRRHRKPDGSQTGQTAPPAAGASSSSGQSGGSRRGAGGPTRVTTANATSEDMPILRKTIGTVASPANLTVTSETQGIVTEILVGDGAPVRKGDVLVRLDTRIAEATVAKDRAALARDQASLEHAQSALSRQQKLVSTDAISQQTLEDSITTVKTAKATVDLDQASLNADLVTLSQKEIHAPFDGRLGAFDVVVGSLVQPQSSIVRLTSLDPLEASFTLPERDVGLVQQAVAAGQTISVEVAPLGTDQTVSGRLDFVDTSVDAASGSFVGKARLSNDAGTLMPGQSLAVTVTLGVRPVVAVPTVSLQPTQAGTVVYVVGADGKIAVKPVSVALTVGDRSGLDGGLVAGEHVVVEGQVRLAEGMTVIDTSAAASDATPSPVKLSETTGPEVKP